VAEASLRGSLQVPHLDPDERLDERRVWLPDAFDERWGPTDERTDPLLQRDHDVLGNSELDRPAVAQDAALVEFADQEAPPWRGLGGDQPPIRNSSTFRCLVLTQSRMRTPGW
jgi:hypothetical protein